MEAYGTHDEEKENKNITQCAEHHYTQASTNNVIKTYVFYKQVEVQRKQTSFLCGNRNGHHNTELRK